MQEQVFYIMLQHTAVQDPQKTFARGLYAGWRAFMRFLPAACFFSSFFLRETSPP